MLSVLKITPRYGQTNSVDIFTLLRVHLINDCPMSVITGCFQSKDFSSIPHPLFSRVPLITYSSVPHRLCECEPSDELQRTNNDRASSQGEQEQEYTHPCSQGWSEETLCDISFYTTTSEEQTQWQISKQLQDFKI